MYALRGQLYATILKSMGIIPTLVLLSFWKVYGLPYFVSKCYEFFYFFNLLCIQLDQIICEVLNVNWNVGLRVKIVEVLEVIDSPLPSY